MKKYNFAALVAVAVLVAVYAVVALVAAPALPALVGTLAVAFTVSAVVVEALKVDMFGPRFRPAAATPSASAEALPSASAEASIRKDGWGRRKAILLVVRQGIRIKVKGRRLSVARLFLRSVGFCPAAKAPAAVLCAFPKAKGSCRRHTRQMAHGRLMEARPIARRVAKANAKAARLQAQAEAAVMEGFTALLKAVVTGSEILAKRQARAQVSANRSARKAARKATAKPAPKAVLRVASGYNSPGVIVMAKATPKVAEAVAKPAAKPAVKAAAPVMGEIPVVVTKAAIKGNAKLSVTEVADALACFREGAELVVVRGQTWTKAAFMLRHGTVAERQEVIVAADYAAMVTVEEARREARLRKVWAAHVAVQNSWREAEAFLRAPKATAKANAPALAVAAAVAMVAGVPAIAAGLLVAYAIKALKNNPASANAEATISPSGEVRTPMKGLVSASPVPALTGTVAVQQTVENMVEVDPFTTCTVCNNDAFTGDKPVEVPFVCGRCKVDEVYYLGLMKAEEEASKRDAKDLEEHLQVLAAEKRLIAAEKEAYLASSDPFDRDGGDEANSLCTDFSDYKDRVFSVGLLAFAGTTTAADIANALMGQSLTELLQGGPAFALFALVAAVAGLATLSWANREEKKGNNGKENGPMRLFSGPFIRPVSEDASVNAEATLDSKEALVGQEGAPSPSNDTPNTHSQKEAKMGIIEKSDEVLRLKLQQLKLADFAEMSAGRVSQVKTYGRVLESMGFAGTALTEIHEGFREMVIRDLSPEQVRDLDGRFITVSDKFVTIVRDSQSYEFPKECLKVLLEEVIVAGNAVGGKKPVSLQEVNKYFGSLLWANAKTVDLSLDEILVMKAASKFYDGTVYVSESFAKQAGWEGYAIRRILTAMGLIKGMIIVLPDNYFPRGKKVIASETKAHLMLRVNRGKVIVMQPQGNGHSGNARTLSMQAWAMLMGPFVGSRRFNAFAQDSYEYAGSNLDKAVEKLLAPAADEEEGRDKLLAEAARLHGFNPAAAFRSYGKAMADKLSKAYDPMKVNVSPFAENGDALAPEGYPLMLPWMALVEAFGTAGQTAPKWMQEKLEAQKVIETRLFKRANGAVAVLVRNMKRLDAATINGIRQMVIAAIATRIPTGKTSGVEVLLFDAEEFGTVPADIGSALVGRKAKDIEYWLFPNEETLEFKILSEGGDDDDLYKFLVGGLHKIACDGLQWRAEILEETAESKESEAKLRAFLRKFANQLRVDNAKLKNVMALKHATTTRDNGSVAVAWPSLLGVKKAKGGYMIRTEEVVEDVIYMTEETRSSVSHQAGLFAKVMVANNESPFSAAIGTVAQSHKFAIGILAGHIVLPEHLRKFGKTWALFLVRTILLSDMVDACNKGKGYKQAAEALQELNWAWGWLCYQIAKAENAEVICPPQYLVSVPPMAKELFESCHGETVVLNGTTRKPGAMLSNLFAYHRELGNKVEAMARNEHDRMEFAATVSVMGKAVSIPMGGFPSAEAFAAPIWHEVWVDSGARKAYLDGLATHREMEARGVDIRDLQRFMEALMDMTVWSAHANFDSKVITALHNAHPDEGGELHLDWLQEKFKIAKLAMIYVNGFKGLHIESNSLKILMEENGKFAASGGIPSYLLPTAGKSCCGWFVGGSEILLEWMMDPATIAAVEAEKSATGDFNFVVFSMKTEAFGPLANGQRELKYSESDFNGKTALEILAMPGVHLAGSLNDESHELQSTFLASVAENVKKKRRETLAALKRAKSDHHAVLGAMTFAELLREFRVTTIEKSVTGAAHSATIEAYNWVDAQRQAYAQFPNTFVVVQFGRQWDPDGDKVEETVEVVEKVAPAPVVVAPVVTAKKEKGDLLGRLNRIHGIKEVKAEKAEAITANAEATEEPSDGYSFTLNELPVPAFRCVGNFALAGLQYSSAKDVAERELVEGAEITLVRNVAHPKDANAVEVHVNGYRFGYVPKETAKRLAPRMDIGVKAWAVVTGWEHGFVRFDLFLGKTPTTLETFNYQRDEIDRACDKLMYLETCVIRDREACDAYVEQKERAEATLAHFAVLCGSLKL